MKKAAIIVSILAVVAVLAYVFFNQGGIGWIQGGQRASIGTQNQPTAAAATTVPVVRSGDRVIAEGRLVPIKFVDLSFITPGLVDKIKVNEGEPVSVGQSLASLSNQAQLQSAVTAAQLEVLNAQQTLDQLSVDAPLAAAQALADLVNAPIAVQDAERQVNNLKGGVVNSSDIDIARANVAFAQKKLNDAQKAYAPYANKPQSDLTRAVLLTRLSNAQKDYDAQVAHLNSLLGSASDTQVTQAEANLALARVKQAEAERRYNILKDGPDPDQVALAKARLANAQAQLAAAQAALSNLELTSPISGTLASMNLKVGQYVTPGNPVIEVVDFSNWLLETTNLNELNVVNVNMGNPVIVACDAIPDTQFPGVVERIKPMGQNSQGDITYTVVVGITQSDPRLLWNMTCTATINTKP